MTGEREAKQESAAAPVDQPTLISVPINQTNFSNVRNLLSIWRRSIREVIYFYSMILRGSELAG